MQPRAFFSALLAALILIGPAHANDLLAPAEHVPAPAEQVPALAQDLPPQASVTGFTGYAQSYTLSCESRSAADWAAFWETPVSEAEFQSRLPRSDDPNLGFVGSPYDPWGSIPPYSYGVHADPVAGLLREYGLPAEARHDLAWDDLRAEIAANRPVIVWVISEMWAGRPVRYTTQAGASVVVAYFEHTMVLTGYTETTVTLLDAYSGYSKSFSLSAFMKSWGVLGNMAVVWAPDVPFKPHIPASYEVLPGEYLHSIAAQWELPWQELAALNQLVFPYALQPGQMLLLQGDGPVEPISEYTISPVDWLTTPLPLMGPQPVGARLFLAVLIQSGPVQDGVVPSEVKNPEMPAENDQSAAETYIVQPGDYLTGIAERFDLGWQNLADLNGISYPYTVYPGQVLRLK